MEPLPFSSVLMSSCNGNYYSLFSCYLTWVIYPIQSHLLALGIIFHATTKTSHLISAIPLSCNISYTWRLWTFLFPITSTQNLMRKGSSWGVVGSETPLQCIYAVIYHTLQPPAVMYSNLEQILFCVLHNKASNDRRKWMVSYCFHRFLIVICSWIPEKQHLQQNFLEGFLPKQVLTTENWFCREYVYIELPSLKVDKGKIRWSEDWLKCIFHMLGFHQSNFA